MSQETSISEFSQEICDKLDFYVYRLIDPRNAETFYVGKGKGNRLFAHVNGVVGEGDATSEKIARIREIRNAGLNVIHIIHRHGMSAEVAHEVEAALIDAFPGLSNEVAGHYSSERGPMHAWEIKQRYEAPVADFRHKALLISVNRSASEKELYHATRYAWRLSKEKAEKAEVVLAVQQGMIIGAFVADQWLASTPENFPGFPEVEGRYGFVGHPAPAPLSAQYVHKRIPEHMRQRGAANPIRYVNF